MKVIKKWEIWGAVLTIIIGSMLHFVFEWSGSNKVVAIFGAVNESTWEHLKLAFWPTFIFSAIEWIAWGKNQKNFCFATFIKLISMPIIIVGLFYAWLAILPDNLLWDVSIFVIAVIVGFLLSYKILIAKIAGPKLLSAFLIFVMLLAFSLFTYFPPKIFLMHDPVKNGYGIEK